MMIGLLHISDLHMGEHPQWVNSQRRFPGNFHPVQGHDELAAESLAREWEFILQIFPSAITVVTGDLTRQGHGHDFGCAHRFIHAYWSNHNQPLARTGLNAGGDRVLTVPGNHDFWDGSTFLGFFNVGRNILGPHFCPLPWVIAVYSQDIPGIELHLVGLDSCSGLPRLSFQQAIARGAIDSGQLQDASRYLQEEASAAQARGNNIIRVVLVHHPPGNCALPSQQEFEQWLYDNHVYAVLTGHTHRPTTPPPGQIRPPYHLCCGTTLQAGTLNHFYFHSIRLEEGTDFVWETREWRRQRNSQGWSPLGGTLVWSRGGIFGSDIPII